MTEPASPEACTASRISLVGLSEVRDALGARSPQEAERLNEVALGVIQRHLAPGDVLERDGAGAWVILFSGLPEEQAELKCREISSQIAQRFAETDPQAAPRVEAVHALVPRTALAAGDVRSALLGAFSGEAATGWAVQGSAAVEAARTSPGGPAERSGAGAGAPGPGASSPAAWRYEPIWDASQMAVIRFRLAPARADAGSGPAVGGEQTFPADLKAVCRVVGDLIELTATGRRMAVVCRVHEASLLSEAHRAALVLALEQTSPALRRLLGVEVFAPELTGGLPYIQFGRSLEALGIGLSTCAVLGSARTHTSVIESVRTAAVQVPSAAEADASVIQALNVFAEQALSKTRPGALYGARTRSVVLAAIGAGFRFISGPALLPEVDELAHGLRLHAADLYGEMLAAAAARRP